MPYIGVIQESPVVEALTQLAIESYTKTIPDANILSYAYDFETIPIEALRSQAKAWLFVPYTDDTEGNNPGRDAGIGRALMKQYGYICAHRNKWSSIYAVQEALGLTIDFTNTVIIGEDGKSYSIDFDNGTWAGYNVTRAHTLRFVIARGSLGALSTSSNFISYLTNTLTWLVPYFEGKISVVIIEQIVVPSPTAHVVTIIPQHIRMVHV